MHRIAIVKGSKQDIAQGKDHVVAFGLQEWPSIYLDLRSNHYTLLQFTKDTPLPEVGHSARRRGCPECLKAGGKSWLPSCSSVTGSSPKPCVKHRPTQRNVLPQNVSLG